MAVLPPGDPPPSTPAIFRREGEHWTVAYEGRVARVRDAKGLHYLAHLLANPWRELPIDELTAVARTPGARRDRPQNAGDAERDRKAVTNRIRQAIARLRAAHPQLGRHLANSIRTGRRCTYGPERDVRWNERDV
jgi:hypothetical protein